MASFRRIAGSISVTPSFSLWRAYSGKALRKTMMAVIAETDATKPASGRMNDDGFLPPSRSLDAVSAIMALLHEHVMRNITPR
jgi:hypothetical protein